MSAISDSVCVRIQSSASTEIVCVQEHKYGNQYHTAVNEHPCYCFTGNKASDMLSYAVNIKRKLIIGAPSFSHSLFRSFFFFGSHDPH